MNNFQKAQSERILGMYSNQEDILEKGGEGSKGGKVIGHTKSGKPIYAANLSSADYKKTHKDFTKEDHHDAITAHKNDKEQSDFRKETGVNRHETALYHLKDEEENGKSVKTYNDAKKHFKGKLDESDHKKFEHYDKHLKTHRFESAAGENGPSGHRDFYMDHKKASEDFERYKKEEGKDKD